MSKECFRVGLTEDGKTTLTLIGERIGITPTAPQVTLVMNQATCEQLILMLRATYTIPDSAEFS